MIKNKSFATSRKIGIILSYSLIIIQTIVSLIYVPMLLSTIGQKEYGLYQLIGSLISYFSIMDFGLSGSVIRYYSMYQANNEKDKIENLLAISRIMYGLIAIVLFFIAIVLYLNLGNIFSSSLSMYELNESKKIFVLLIINITITLLTNIQTAVITSNEKFVFLKGISIIQVILQPILVYLLIINHPYAFTVAFVQTILNVIIGLLKVFYCKCVIKMKSKYHYFDKDLVLGMSKLSLSIFIVSIVDQIFWKTNQFVLGIISGTSAVAIYSIASQIYMNYMPLSSAIQNVFLPHITKNIQSIMSKNQTTSIMVKIGRIQYYILALVLFGFVAVGSDFIHLWAGPEYTTSYYIALWILFPFTIDLIENVGLIFLQSLNIYHIRAKIYSFTAILNIILVLSLGVKYGPLGCGIGTGIAMFVGNGILMNIYYYKNLNINIIFFFKNIIKLSVVPFILSIFSLILKHVYPISNIKILLIYIIIFVSLYCLFQYLFFMNSYEKNIILEFKRKIMK